MPQEYVTREGHSCHCYSHDDRVSCREGCRIVGFPEDKELTEDYIKDLDEYKLIHLAQSHPNDQISAKAMRYLRSKYDESYFWCHDCDLAVVKKNECCLNRTENGKSNEIQSP